MRVDICLPVHNEEQVLEANCLRLLDFCRSASLDCDWRIVIVVNGSSDRSSEIARDLEQREPEIHAVIIAAPGRGQALRQAWSESESDIVCYMDSDLVVDLESLPRLLEPLLNATANLSFGSRFQAGALVKRSLARDIISHSYNSLAHLFVNHDARDLQCGFKALTKEAFIRLAPLASDNHWFFDTELIIWAERLGLKVVEVPVNWQERRFGRRKSKVKLIKDSIYFLKSLAALRKKLHRHEK